MQPSSTIKLTDTELCYLNITSRHKADLEAVPDQEPVWVVLFVQFKCVSLFKGELLFCGCLVVVQTENGTDWR
jgi:hypothetical protein